MLTRDSNVLSPDAYYNKALLQTPSVKQSVFEGLARGYTTPITASDDLTDYYSSEPQGQAQTSALRGMEITAQAPNQSILQRGATDIAWMVGAALNPINWLGGAAGEGLAEAGEAGLEKVAPSINVFAKKSLADVLPKPIAKYIPDYVGDEALTTGLIGDKAAKSFAQGVGFSVPANIADNYNADTNHINWGGVARSSGEMGGVGILIGSVPFAYGMVRAKLNRAAGEPESTEVTQARLDAALANKTITPDEHKWFSDYLDSRANPGDLDKAQSLQTTGSKLINASGRVSNTVTNETPFHLITPEDMKSMQGSLSDESLASLGDDQRTAISDYIVKGSFDNIQNDQVGLDGLNGYLDLTREKLDSKEAKLSEADQILDKYMDRSVNDNKIFSQHDLFKTMQKFGFESSHVDNLPITIPDNLKTRMATQLKINKLNSKLQKEYRKSGVKNLQTQRRIDELESSKLDLLTPKEELNYLKDKLLKDGLPKRLENSKDYQRLSDLAQVWPNAKTLLDRVHLEDEYNKQEAIHKLFSRVKDMSEGNFPKLANPDDVVNYLKTRIERKVNHVEDDAELNEKLNQYLKVPTDTDTALKEQQATVANTKAPELKEDFNQSDAKTKEFKSKEGVFKNLISCVMGSLNG